MGQNSILTTAMFFLLPGVVGAVALVVWRLQLGILSAFGLGYLGERVATVLRGVSGIKPLGKLGVLDPILWMLVCALLIGGLIRLFVFLRARRLSSSARDDAL